MGNPEDIVRTVLCDMAASGATWEQAYAELISVIKANMHGLEVRGHELVSELTKQGKSEAYIRFQVEGWFQRAYDREMLCLHATRAVQESGYRG